ncbi:MAG: restriction endonuclease [Peptostreptococcaceae bacterium]|nr:restriction endonuclease [Peptostreptococcaceae bacterium]
MYIIAHLLYNCLVNNSNIYHKGEQVNYYYDEFSPTSIELYAKKLTGFTFRNILEHEITLSESTSLNKYGIEYFESNAAKGSLGHLIELYYFHYMLNPCSSADFNKAGVELKVTPYKINKNSTRSAKERLVLTNIDYSKVINETLETSHLLDKCNLILLIYYLYTKGINKLDYTINYVQLFQIPEKDLDIIRSDFNKIINKIKSGDAHNLSEGDTLYLGACTKGATANSSYTSQPFSDVQAKHRAFCFKNSYMTYVLNTYIIPKKKTYDNIQYSGDFENYIFNTINDSTGLSITELMSNYNINYMGSRPKNLESSLVFKILGLKSNNAEEFIKAGIKVKTIRLENSQSLKENISLPAFDFIEMSKESWDDSKINTYLSETKFLFVVFKKDSEYKKYEDITDYPNMDKHLHLYFATFWNMSNSDIENEVKVVWSKTKERLNEGIKAKKHGSRTFNNLPSSKENRVCHIRPHGKNKDDTLPLPSGQVFTKQSFFLNASYVRDEILALKKEQRN